MAVAVFQWPFAGLPVANEERMPFKTRPHTGLHGRKEGSIEPRAHSGERRFDLISNAAAAGGSGRQGGGTGTPEGVEHRVPLDGVHQDQPQGELGGKGGRAAARLIPADRLPRPADIRPDIGEKYIALFPENRAFPPPLLLLGREATFAALAHDQDELVLQRHVGPSREHPGAHEFGGGIGGLAPENGGQASESDALQRRQGAHVVGVEPELAVEAAHRITDINAGKTAREKDPMDFLPDRIQERVHAFESLPRPPASQRRGDPRILAAEDPVPHGDHRIGRRGHHQVNARVGHRFHPAGIRLEYPVAGL